MRRSDEQLRDAGFDDEAASSRAGMFDGVIAASRRDARACARRRRGSCRGASKCSASTPTTPAAGRWWPRCRAGSRSSPARVRTAAFACSTRAGASASNCDPAERIRPLPRLGELRCRCRAPLRAEFSRRARWAPTSRFRATCRAPPASAVRARWSSASAARWPIAAGCIERPEWTRAIGTPLDLAGYLGAVENGLTFGSLAGTSGVGTHGGSEDHTAILTCRAGRVQRLRLRAGAASGRRDDAGRLAVRGDDERCARRQGGHRQGPLQPRIAGDSRAARRLAWARRRRADAGGRARLGAGRARGATRRDRRRARRILRRRSAAPPDAFRRRRRAGAARRWPPSPPAIATPSASCPRRPSAMPR